MISPRIEAADAMTMVGLMAHYTPESRVGIQQQWQAFNAQSFGGDVLGDCAWGIIINPAMDGSFEYLTAWQVSTLPGDKGDFVVRTIEPQEYAIFETREPLSGMGSLMQDIFQHWLPASGRKPANAPMLERYGPAFDPESGTGGFEIWLPLA